MLKPLIIFLADALAVQTKFWIEKLQTTAVLTRVPIVSIGSLPTVGFRTKNRHVHKWRTLNSAKNAVRVIHWIVTAKPFAVRLLETSFTIEHGQRAIIIVTSVHTVIDGGRAIHKIHLFVTAKQLAQQQLRIVIVLLVPHHLLI